VQTNRNLISSMGKTRFYTTDGCSESISKNLRVGGGRKVMNLCNLYYIVCAWT